MKHIDVDRLKAEMEKRMHICEGIFERDSDIYYQGKAVAYQETLSLIDSLQQEIPEVDLEKEEYVGVAESPLKTFQRVNEFEDGANYRH